MSIYTERWIARPSWLELSISERIAYLDQMDGAFRSLSDSGAQLIGLVLDEDENEGSRRCLYVAVWLMPDEGSLERRLQEILDEAGWHDYFEPALPSHSDRPSPRRSTFRNRRRRPDEA